MSGGSSSPEAWWSLLEPAAAELFFSSGDPEDLRLGDIVTRWDGGPIELRAGQPVLIGFPCDEGVRRNGGRPGAAAAPDAIRKQLYRMTSWDPQYPSRFDRTCPTGVNLVDVGLLDTGNVRMSTSLEASQEALGVVVAAVLTADAVPILLGGGHETAYGHYLGYVKAKTDCCILNVDAHLDVRTYEQGAHSGSPFRQACEHPSTPLPPERYVVFGAQPQSVSKSHLEFVRQHHGRVIWSSMIMNRDLAKKTFADELSSQNADHAPVMLTVDADAFRQADVPGCSAPGPAGLDGSLWPEMAYLAGLSCARSLELVEVNPSLDRDDQTTRWAALGIRQFLVGLALRGGGSPE